MKLTVLGCYGPFAPPGGACSSYLLSHGGGQIVLDMGSGSLAELQRHIRLEEIDAVVLSHLHHDHIGDCLTLRYALMQLRAARPELRAPALFLPRTPAAEFELLTAGDVFNVRTVKDGAESELFGLRLRFSRMTHPVESYAVEAVDEAGRRLVYSGDTTVNPAIVRLAAGADLFLADGGLLQKNWSEHSPHMSVAQACEVGSAARRTLITHHSPLSPCAEIERELSCGAQAARMGEAYIIA